MQSRHSTIKLHPQPPDTLFFLKIFDPQLIKSAEVELRDAESTAVFSSGWGIACDTFLFAST